MISFLRGILFQINNDSVWIDLNGIGYEVQVHQRIMNILPSVGSELFLYTYFQVSENECKLFGFLKAEELSLFKKLIGVSGIGAKAALSVLAAIEPADFYTAIVSGDEKTLVKIPGIGKKTAQRLVFELKDKIGQGEQVLALNTDDNSNIGDVLEALESLGYNRSEVFPLLTELKEKGQLHERVEDNIKMVLKLQALKAHK